MTNLEEAAQSGMSSRSVDMLSRRFASFLVRVLMPGDERIALGTHARDALQR
jgi:hypothetical protein